MADYTYSIGLDLSQYPEVLKKIDKLGASFSKVNEEATLSISFNEQQAKKQYEKITKEMQKNQIALPVELEYKMKRDAFKAQYDYAKRQADRLQNLFDPEYLSKNINELYNKHASGEIDKFGKSIKMTEDEYRELARLIAQAKEVTESSGKSLNAYFNQQTVKIIEEMSEAFRYFNEETGRAEKLGKFNVKKIFKTKDLEEAKNTAKDLEKALEEADKQLGVIALQRISETKIDISINIK